jgi:hypothetical protein
VPPAAVAPRSSVWMVMRHYPQRYHSRHDAVHPF